MDELTKKRMQAIGIDAVIMSAATAALEPLVKKNVKSSFAYTVVLPSVVSWGLEVAQISLWGQTIGQRAVGIKVIDQEGGTPSAGQVLKRAVHRDSISGFSYLKNREAFDATGGTEFPHDQYAGTLVVASK